MSHAEDSLAGLLEAALPVSLRHIPHHLGNISAQLGARAALVGGLPRDLLRIRQKQLERDAFASEVRDFDVSVEGDAVLFAFEAARRLPGRLVVNAAFHTATLYTEDPVKLDFTTARRETYASAGMLPEVDVSGVSLEEDLLRRDFTLAALALELGERDGRLIDVAGGAGDIRDRRVRVLHDRSFFDDPTRLFRALRYSMRLDYKIEEATQQQMMAAIMENSVDFLSPERLRYEIECIGGEDCWGEVWQAIDYVRLSGCVHPAMDGLNRGWKSSDARALDIALRHHAGFLLQEDVPPWIVRSAWTLGVVPLESMEAVCTRCGFYSRHRLWLVQARAVMRAVAESMLASLPPSLASSVLEKFPRQAVIVAAFSMQPRTQEEVQLRSTMLRYLTDWSQVRCGLDGHALMELGIPQGPQLGELRGRLRYLRIDGLVQSDVQELEAARRIAGDMLEHGSLSSTKEPA
jgi:tRNA nucleotidyltransferase (CCA-adding enzyme)